MHRIIRVTCASSPPTVAFIFGIFATWIFCCPAFGGCGEEDLTGSGFGKIAILDHIKRVPISTLTKDPYWFFSADGFSPSRRVVVLTKDSEERLLAIDARVAASMGFPSFAKQILMLRDSPENKQWSERVQDRFAHYNSDDQQILGLAKLWEDHAQGSGTRVCFKASGALIKIESAEKISDLG